LFEIVDLTIVDAEYSNTLDRVIAVSTHSNTMEILGGFPLQRDTIQLNLPPISVSLSPNGLLAAVGHDGWISHVDLTNQTLLATLPVTTIAADIVLTEDSYAYVFPMRDQWVSIHSVNTQNGAETMSDYATIYERTKAKLHNDNQYIYTVDDSLERFEINDGVVGESERQPYQFNTDACDDLWLGEDGRRIFTQCGNVFRASPYTEDDMTFNGKLSELTKVTHLHHSLDADSVAVIASDFSDTNFEQSYSYHGKFVFYSADGSRIYTIAQSQPDSVLMYDFAIWSTATQ